MTERAKPAPLTDSQRHERFVDMAREVEASEDPKAFEDALTAVTPPVQPKKA
jgi:hypothetical protein